MGKKTEIEKTRYIELSIPQAIMADTAEIVEENEMEATIIGRVEDEDSITIGFEYMPEQRESIMEILELIEDFNEQDNEQEQDED